MELNAITCMVEHRGYLYLAVGRQLWRFDTELRHLELMGII